MKLKSLSKKEASLFQGKLSDIAEYLMNKNGIPSVIQFFNLLQKEVKTLTRGRTYSLYNDLTCLQPKDIQPLAKFLRMSDEYVLDLVTKAICDDYARTNRADLDKVVPIDVNWFNVVNFVNPFVAAAQEQHKTVHSFLRYLLDYYQCDMTTIVHHFDKGNVLTPTQIYQILLGKHKITGYTSIAFGRLLCVPDHYFLSRQYAEDIYLLNKEKAETSRTSKRLKHQSA